MFIISYKNKLTYKCLLQIKKYIDILKLFCRWQKLTIYKYNILQDIELSSMASCAPEDAGYVCTLEQKWIKKAKDELFEIPEDRLAAVQAFRDWIKQQKHIKVGKLGKLTFFIKKNCLY